MLPYNEIKNDVKAGFKYREYEGTWYKYKYTIIFDKLFNTIVAIFEDNEYEAICEFRLDEFLNEVMESYNNYVKVMDKVIGYNMLPKEE